jgi:hypothetical protein
LSYRPKHLLIQTRIASRRPAVRRSLLALALTALTVVGITQASSGSQPSAAATTSAARAPRVFAFYYLWWSDNHWRSALGSHYPTAASPLPLPATLDATGCHPQSRYAGNSLTDVPKRIYSQDDPGFIEADVRQAAAAGLAGFIVNWAGTGQAGQTVTSNPYSKRLQTLVTAVHKVNSAGIPFKLWLSYKASARVLSQATIVNDLRYFTAHYGKDPAFDRARSSRPTMIWQGSRKYSLSVLQAVSGQFGSAMRILGDEQKWSATRGRYLDGNAYYWSSQNPYSNPQSFQQLGTLAANVRASGRNPDGSGKAWIAPIAPGYDRQLAGGTSCVPRKGGQTLKKLYDGNLGSHPQDFGLISWNEITEATYIDPMTRYGSQDLSVLTSLIRNGG